MDPCVPSTFCRINQSCFVPRIRVGSSWGKPGDAMALGRLIALGFAALARRGQGGRAPRAVQVREGGCSRGAGSPEPNLCQRRVVSRCLLCLGASRCFIALPAAWVQGVGRCQLMFFWRGLAASALRPSRTVSAGLAGGVAEAANYLVTRSPLSWVRGAGTAVVNEQLQHHPVQRWGLCSGYPTNPMAEPSADAQPGPGRERGPS